MGKAELKRWGFRCRWNVVRVSQERTLEERLLQIAGANNWSYRYYYCHCWPIVSLFFIAKSIFVAFTSKDIWNIWLHFWEDSS